MVKSSLLVLILIFIQSCATAPQKHVKELVIPKKWQARSLKEAHCGKPRQVAHELWTFCHGKQSAHGILSRTNLITQTIQETVIPSRDPLAMSVSVTAESPWVIGSDKVWVGTEDGRILVFDFFGKQIQTRAFAAHAWIQHLKLVDGKLFAIVSLYQNVELIKLDDELSVEKSTALSETLQSVDLLIQDEKILVATDKGFMHEFRPDLSLQKTLALSPGVALGEMNLVSRGLYVGNEEGVLFFVDFKDQVKAVKKSESSISSAPVISSEGVWVAYDEEGSLRLFDMELNLKKKLEVPFNRSLLSLKPLFYGQHLLLQVTSFGNVHLLTTQGEVLLSHEEPGALIWEIIPSEGTDNLEATRSPSGQNR
jgi:outer membrane protein assembly factor BamB